MYAQTHFVRFSQAAFFSGLVTFSLFYLMQILVAEKPMPPVPEIPGRDVSFNTVEPPTEVPDQPAPRPKPTEGPGIPVYVPQTETLPRDPRVIYPLVSVGKPVVEVAQPGNDVPVATVQMTPIYPLRALRAEVEGFVRLEFTVNAKGLVENIRVLEETPKGYGLGKAAVNAAKTFRYSPRTENGKPVATDGVIEKFEFVLENGK